MDKKPNIVSLAIRSALLYFGDTFVVIFHSLASIAISPFVDFKTKQKFVVIWCHFCLWWAKVICGIRYEVTGLENLKKIPNGVVLAKHQSEWETFLLQVMFIPSTTVLKKELLLIPFFGWALRLLEPIVIDRKARVNALKQVLAQGQEKLKDGRWVIIFPEGTRVQPGHPLPFNAGGAMLACKGKVPILPIAHNAGEFWPAKKFLKYPGTVKVVIGEPIFTDSISTSEANKRAEEWIRKTMAEISEKERFDLPPADAA